MGFLNRLGRANDGVAVQDRERVGESIERIMALHPQLRLARQYRKRLAPAVGTSLAYLRDLVDAVPAPREASAAAWAVDPYVHAWFAAPDDVASTLSRAAELRAFFDNNSDLPEACAVLGMEMTERHILGVRQEGDTMRRDVPQTTVSFSDHQVRMCGRDDAELRNGIVARLLDQLALEGLARTAADKSRRTALEKERALLKTRLQLLERQGRGIRGLIGGDVAQDLAELERLAAQVEENAQNLAGLGLREEALDRELEYVRAVFAHPERHLTVSTRRLRLNRMNVVLEGEDAQEGEELAFRIASVPTMPPRIRAFSLIRFARASMLPQRSMFDEAEQQLASGLWS
jgi:hypothetical protein